jgi:biotin carboxylase
MTKDNARFLLYLDTRDLPPERDGEILAAVESGHRLIVATDRPDKFRYHQVDHLIDTPLGNYELAHHDIDAFVRSHGIALAGVLCWKDREVELASRLAAHFHLRGSSAEVARRVRDKAETRKALSPLNANPRHAVVSNRSEFLAAVRSLQCPCLLKPAGNSGSRGILRVTDADSHAPWDEFCDYNGRASGDMFSYYADHALLEEEVTGSEHSVAGLVSEGRVHIMALADKRFEREIFMQYENVVPSRLDGEIQAAIVDLVTRAVQAIGLTDAGFHADVMVDGGGKPYILEIGGRLGGEMINSHLIPLAYGGYSPYRQLIEVLTGGAPLLPEAMYRQPRMQAGVRIVRAPHLGTIAQIHGLEALHKHPAVRVVLQMKGSHSTVHQPRDKFKEYELVYIIAQCSLGEDMHRLLDSLEALVRIEMHSEVPVA